jgi:hypothetical protein
VLKYGKLKEFPTFQHDKQAITINDFIKNNTLTLAYTCPNNGEYFSPVLPMPWSMAPQRKYRQKNIT